MRTIRGAVCSICGVAFERHQPCAVCFSTNAHTRCCSFCRAQHKALGIDWNEEDAPTGGAADVGSDERCRVELPLAELTGRTRARRPAQKLARVLQLLLVREELTVVQRFDSRGRSRGSYCRREPLSRRGVARRAGCSHTYVNRVFREHVSCTPRPSSKKYM